MRDQEVNKPVEADGKTKFTIEEYLHQEEDSEEKHEYDHNEIGW